MNVLVEAEGSGWMKPLPIEATRGLSRKLISGYLMADIMMLMRIGDYVLKFSNTS